MITNDLYSEVLIRPIENLNANKLYIVSGYASATFTRRHLLDIAKKTNDFEVNLIIGMPRSNYDHLAFLELHNQFPDKFKGYYYNSTPPVHSKSFSWFSDTNPLIGYSGSANYSQYGFFSHLQINQMTEDNPSLIYSFFEKLIGGSTYIPDVVIQPVEPVIAPILGDVPAGQIRWDIMDEMVTISFLEKNGTLPQISGLNWGQRRSKSVNKRTGVVTWSAREPNQAYLSLRKDARKEGFLPDRAYTFTLITDDNHSFDCVVAQDARKAIHSTNNNSELGRYIRNRLGVALGAPISLQDLTNYGRTDYTLKKLDEETFLFDFSV